jgi:hypothetical protein
MFAKKITLTQFSEVITKLKVELPLFSQLKWLQLFDKRLCIASISNDDNQVIGFFYGLEGKKLNLSYFINTPFTPHCGLYYINKSSNSANYNTYEKKIAQVVVDFLISQKYSLVQFSLPPTIIDTQPFIWKKYLVTTKYTYQIKLSESKEVLFSNLSSEKRKSIRKAESDNLRIELVQDIKGIEAILTNTFIKNKVKYIASLFHEIVYEFANKENAFAFAAYDEANKLIAATFCLYDQHTCYYLFGGFDTDNKHHGAGVKCMWESILYAKNLNLDIFDFEGSMLKEVEKYFREFGGTLVPYYQVKHSSKLLKLIS